MNDTPLWGSDRELDQDGARSAVQQAFPELELDEVRLLGSGWDFDTFALGLRWVARFPRRADVIPRLERERDIMPVLGTALAPLGIEVPELHGIGEAGDAFPYPFLVQRRIWGLTLEAVGPSRFSARVATHLGQALASFHAVGYSIPLDHASGDEETWLTHAAESLAVLSPESRARIPEATKWIEAGPSVPEGYTGPPRLLHNDLSPEHVRVARTGLHLIGILDWSDVALGDPARDFAVLYMWAGPTVLDRLMKGYTLEMDDGFRERVRFLARVGSVAWLRDTEVTGGDIANRVDWVQNSFLAD